MKKGILPPSIRLSACFSRGLLPGLFLGLSLSGCNAEKPPVGPTHGEIPVGEGPCFEVNLLDGLEDGAELRTVFSCLNSDGAFAELAPLVDYLAEDPEAGFIVDLLSQGFSSGDLAAILDLAIDLLTEEANPASKLLALTHRAYEVDLFTPVLAMAGVGAEQIAAEEEAGTGGTALDLVRGLLEEPRLDDLLYVVEAASAPFSEEAMDALLHNVLSLALNTSTASGRSENLLLATADELVGGDFEAGPLPVVLAIAQTLVGEDAVFEDLVFSVAELSGAQCPSTEAPCLDGLGMRMRALLAYDSTCLASLSGPLMDEGDLAHCTPVCTASEEGTFSCTGPAVIDEVLDAALPLLGDTSLLSFSMDLGGEVLTVEDLLTETVNELYLHFTEVRLDELITEILAVIDTLCTYGDTTICQVADPLRTPLAALANAGVLDLALPPVHALLKHRTLSGLTGLIPKDPQRLGALLALVGDTRDLQLTLLTAPLLPEDVELLDLLNAFIVPETGRPDEALRRTRELLLWLLERDDRGISANPRLFNAFPLVQSLLRPGNPAADLDPLLAEVTALLLSTSPDEPLSWDNLMALWEEFQPLLEEHPVDLLVLVREVLDDPALLGDALHLLADARFLDLLAPDPEGGDLLGWMDDLIVRGVFDRILDFARNLIIELGGGGAS